MTTKAMTPQEFANAMRSIKHYNLDETKSPVKYDPKGTNYDPEMAHVEMDTLICDLLISLGYVEGISVFYDTPRWYA